MSNTGFIVLHRSFLEWEWYSNINTSRLFLHLLLLANHQDVEWQGMIIRRGELVTSVSKLSKETGLTDKQIRVALEHLKRTGEVATKGANKYTLINIVNWRKFQDFSSEKGEQKGEQKGNQRATNNNDNKYINNNICAFFENLWDLYPNKKGKNRVTKQTLKDISAIGEERMTAAVKAYAKEVEGVDKKFIKHGSTFFNGDYKDYLNQQPVKEEKKEKAMPRLGHDLKR